MDINTAEKNDSIPVIRLPSANTWEEGEAGFIISYLKTLRQLLFSPTDFFIRTSGLKGWIMPVLFAVLCDMTGFLLIIIYGHNTLESLGYFKFYSNISLPWLFVASPLFIIIGYIFGAIILHASVIILGGKGGINKTLRIVTYSAASSVLHVLPYGSNLFSFIFRIAITIKGLKALHNFSAARAVFAILMPFIGLFALGILIVLIPLSIIGASFLKELLEFIRMT